MMKLIVAVSLIFLLSSCEKDRKPLPSGKKIYVQVIASQSGSGAAFGLQGLQGLFSAKDLKPLLPNGDEIVFKIQDDSSDVKKSQKYVDMIDKNSTALLTFCSSATQLGIIPQVQHKKIPTLAVIATHDDFTKVCSYMTRLSMSNSREAEVSASYIRDELLMSRVGIIYSKNNIYSKSISEYFERKFKQLDGEVVLSRSIESFNNKKENYQKLIDDSDLDIIFLSTNALLSYKFLKVFNTLQTDVKIFATDGLLSDMHKHFPNDMDILNGVLTIDHYSHSMEFNEQSKILIKYLKKHKLSLNSFTGLGYEAYQILYDALLACKTYNRECVNNKLRNSKLFDGVISNLQTVDGNMQRAIYVNEIQDGKMLRKVKVY